MQHHIDDLENALYNNHWQIINRTIGNEMDISEYWQIAHLYYPNISLALAFEGFDDLEVLPIEKSYGCYVLENIDISLYFSKNNKRQWQIELTQFLEKLKQYVK